MLQNIDLTGQTALIMGASQGIGLATAKVLVNYGATVVLAARSFDKVKAHASAISTSDANALAVTCDVSDYNSVQRATEFTIEKTDRLDILINNAGVIEPLERLIESDPDIWGKAADINYKGVYHCMRAALPHMQQQNNGTIINMSSGAANSALVGWSHYCSTKAAVKKLTEVAHKEFIEKNIHIIGLSPGTVATPMMQKIRDANINPVSHLDWNTHIPPEWVGEGVVFLCSDQGKVFAGTDFSLKTAEGRKLVGLPSDNTPN